MIPIRSQGARAVDNGQATESLIANLLRHHDYSPKPDKTLAEFQAYHKAGEFFPTAGQYVHQCQVPLQAPYHAGKNRKTKVDFVVLNPKRDYVLLSVKSQTSDGSAEQKLEFELQQLIAAELPAAMFVCGPVKGRDANTGWTLATLEEIWERSRYYGGSRLFLFRKLAKLSDWIRDGLPVPGNGRTASDIFAQYCDREP